MPMQDLEDFLEPWLDLPIRRKTYRVPAVSIEDGLFAQNVVEIAAQIKAGAELADADVAKLKLDDDQETDFHRRMLGTVYDEMVDDGIPWEYLKHASRTAFIWTVQTRAEAEEYWAGGGRAEARRPAPQDRLPAKKTPAKKSAPRASAASKKTPSKRGSAGGPSSTTGS